MHIDLETFLIDYYKPTDMVKIKAVELQELLRTKRNCEAREERLINKINALKAKLEYLDENIPTIDLKG